MLFYDWIGIAFSAVLLVLAIISSCLAGGMRANTNDIIIDYYIRINRKYIRSSIWFLAAFYWLTLCSIFSTIVVIYLCAYPTAGQDTKRVFLYSVISLFCTIVNFVTNPRDISTTYRKCHILFDEAILCARDGHDNDPTWSACERRYFCLYRVDHITEEMLANVIK